jgi:hypothetical protein
MRDGETPFVKIKIIPVGENSGWKIPAVYHDAGPG